MELTAATLTALWAVTSYYFWKRDKPSHHPLPATESVSAPPDILIAYASQSGQARELATRYASQLVRADSALQDKLDVRCTSQLNPDDIPQYRKIFIVASTYGQGEPPDTAQRFSKAMTLLPDQHLSAYSVQYAVLALGDNSYTHFCQFGHWVHRQFMRIGADPLSPCIEVNRLNEDALETWQHLLGSTLSCQLDADQEAVPFQLIDRRLLNPDSPNAGLFWLRLQAQSGAKSTQLPQPGDLIDIHLFNGERRTYSLANAPASQPGTTLELIVRRHYAGDGTPGIGSHYLTERIDAGSQIRVSLRRGFDWSTIAPERPLILIAAGSGLAGIRAGLQARQHNPHGANWLIFGERDPVYDRPCEDELLDYRKLGVLQRLDRVWSQSREEEAMRYAQDVLRRDSDELASYLIQGGYIYVCGSASGLGTGVHDTLIELLGEPLVTMLRHQGRYVRDIY